MSPTPKTPKPQARPITTALTGPVVIAFDLATTTGWAVLTLEGARVDSGHWSFAPRKNRGPEDRWLRARSAFVDLFAAFDGRVALLACERPVMVGRSHERAGKARVQASTPIVACGLLSLAELSAASKQVPCVRIPPAKVKKAATGRGNCGKPAVQAAVAKLCGLEKVQADEADALAVGLAATRIWTPAQILAGEVQP